jgi:ribosomal protein S18 acetylase RimI-like enzyme
MIRPLKSTEACDNVAQLIYQTDDVLFPFLFGKIDKAIPKLVDLIALEHNSFSYKHIIAYTENEEILGILLGYNPEEIVSEKEDRDFSNVFSKLEIFSLFCKHMILKPLDDKSDIDGFYIQNISVDEHHRGKGIGTQLIEHCFNEVRQKGINSVFLDVTIENEKAKKLYERKGFSVIKKKNLLFSLGGIYRMKKEL